jgi:hypothetical protein
MGWSEKSTRRQCLWDFRQYRQGMVSLLGEHALSIRARFQNFFPSLRVWGVRDNQSASNEKIYDFRHTVLAR